MTQTITPKKCTKCGKTSAQVTAIAANNWQWVCVPNCRARK
jgi:hypothetical protein